MIKKVIPIYDFAGIAHEVLEQSEFFQSERDLVAVARDTPCAWVEGYVVALQDLRQALRRAPHECTEPSRQFCEREGLHKVIVGACEKKFYFRLRFRACRKDEDRDRDILCPHFLEHLIPIHRRDHEVEDNDIVIRAMERDPRQGLFPVRDDVDGISLHLKPALQG